jgi:hypothetical protein
MQEGITLKKAFVMKVFAFHEFPFNVKCSKQQPGGDPGNNKWMSRVV